VSTPLPKSCILVLCVRVCACVCARVRVAWGACSKFGCALLRTHTSQCPLKHFYRQPVHDAPTTLPWLELAEGADGVTTAQRHERWRRGVNAVGVE
jgi:hypothetical protein